MKSLLIILILNSSFLSMDFNGINSHLINENYGKSQLFNRKENLLNQKNFQWSIKRNSITNSIQYLKKISIKKILITFLVTNFSCGNGVEVLDTSCLFPQEICNIDICKFNPKCIKEVPIEESDDIDFFKNFNKYSEMDENEFFSIISPNPNVKFIFNHNISFNFNLERHHYLIHNLGGKTLYNNYLIQQLWKYYPQLTKNFVVTNLFNGFFQKTCLLDEDYKEKNNNIVNFADYHFRPNNGFNMMDVSLFEQELLINNYYFFCNINSILYSNMSNYDIIVLLTNIKLINNQTNTTIEINREDAKKIFLKKNFQHFKYVNKIDDIYKYHFDKYNYFFQDTLNTQLKTLGDFYNQQENEFIIDNSLYKDIIRGSNGNFIGLRYYENYKLNDFENNFLIGRYIDKSGTIMDNNKEYFYKTSLNYNWFKQKDIEFKGNDIKENIRFMNNKQFSDFKWDQLIFQCSSLITPESFLNNDKNNFFFKCTNNYQLPNILINGHDYSKSIMNIIGFISENIIPFNINYQENKSRYNTNLNLNFFDYLKSTKYNFPIFCINDFFCSFVQDDTKEKIPDIQDNSLGLYFNIDNWTINNRILSSLINYKFNLLSWVINLELNQYDYNNDFYGNQIPYIKKDLIYTNTEMNSHRTNDIYLWIYSCSPYDIFYNKTFNYFYKDLKSEIINENIIGYFFIDNNNNNNNNDKTNEGLNNIKVFFSNNQTFPWFTDNNPIYNETFDIITRIPKSQLWDGIILQTNLDNSKIILGQSKDFQNLYFMRNYTINSFKNNPFNDTIQNQYNEQIYSLNFLPMNIVRKSFQNNEVFTDMIDIDLLNKNFYYYTINLENYNNITLYKKLEIIQENEDLIIAGCNENICFSLDFNGFPMKIISSNPKNIPTNNPNFLSFQWDVKDQWTFIQNNIKYFCNLNKLNYITNFLQNNLALVCYKDNINNFENIRFIMDLEKNTIFYNSQDANLYNKINLVNNDVIYVHKENGKGFSSLYHRRYPKNLFTTWKKDDLTINNLDGTKVFSNQNNFIQFKYRHEIFLNSNFMINQKKDNNYFNVSSVIGDGFSGISFLCKLTPNNKEICLEGDIESSIVYYTQINNNLPRSIESFKPLESTDYGNWIGNLLPKIFQNQKKKTFYKFFRDGVGKTYTIFINDSRIYCNLIIDRPLRSNDNIEFPLGHYCYNNDTKSKFIELLLFPFFDTINKKWTKNPSPWFLCETLNNTHCSFSLLNGTLVYCDYDSNYCRTNFYQFNNNYLDRLNDPFLKDLLNRKYNLSIANFIGLYPKKHYFFPTLLDDSIEGILSIDYQLNDLVFYKQWTLINLINIGVSQLVIPLIFFMVYKWGIFNKTSMNPGCCHRNFLYSYFVIIESKIFKLVQDLLLIFGSDFSNLNKKDFEYSYSFPVTIYTFLGINIFLLFLDIFFILEALVIKSSLNSYTRFFYNKTIETTTSLKQISKKKGKNKTSKDVNNNTDISDTNSQKNLIINQQNKKSVELQSNENKIKTSIKVEDKKVEDKIDDKVNEISKEKTGNKRKKQLNKNDLEKNNQRKSIKRDINVNLYKKLYQNNILLSYALLSLILSVTYQTLSSYVFMPQTIIKKILS